ncbi:UNVERIFIED_CONTAM: DNA cytosine methyltransferase [Actinomycetes bacterium ARC8]|nr:DNA cytosine methyltransferase [Actinomycetes bacterium ARC8]
MSKTHSSPSRAASHDLRFVSLYSGAGGLDLGFARAGFTPVFANDIDPFAVQTYNRLNQVRDPEWLEAASRFDNHSAVCGDVRVAGSVLEEGMADLVIGGPPCQGFSVAGRMDPNDPRSRHVFDFLGLVARIKPRAFVMENVAALARNKRWADVITALKETAAPNYRVELIVLNASHWEVPQARERMFLIGVPHDGPGLTLGDGPTVSNPPTVRAALSRLPRVGMPGNDSLCTASITLAKNPVLRRSPYAGMLFNGQGRVMNLDKPAPTLPASMGGNRTPIVDQNSITNQTSPWIEQYHHSLFNEKGDPLVTLPDDANMRRITVQEAAALQSFPVDVPWQGRQNAIYRQIGNAVPPRLAYHVAQAVARAISPVVANSSKMPVSAL